MNTLRDLVPLFTPFVPLLVALIWPITILIILCWFRESSLHRSSLRLKAVELDPQFAMAYARLGSAYHNLDEPTMAIENMRKGFALREKVSERERLYIEVRYYRWVTGEFEKWAQVC